MVESSSCNSRLYPDFDAPVDSRYGAAYPGANAPPMTTAESERWPLTAAPPVAYAQQEPYNYNAYYVPPSYGEPPVEHRPCHRQHHQDRRHQRRRGCNHQGFVCTTLRLALFHTLNAVLGIVAFVAVITGVHVSIGLIPLCCVGLVLFRGVVVVVQWLATLDVKLSNYIASPHEEHVLMTYRHVPLGGFVGLRLSPELEYFSPVSLLGALYFSTVKFVVGIVSLVVVSVFASLPMLLLAFNNDDESEWVIKVHHYKKVDLHEHPFAFYVLWGCAFIVTIVAMHVVAWLSRAATHFFCCERVTAPEYTIPIVEYPETAATATMYGSNIPTSMYHQSQ
ncbi:putative soluble pyridine nucleotide transhydrogenase [Phytophthora cinnamomi]|uniref:putative soluble pyridine nucleotide transhydrogenase n=1 Tax=Phytophthora cinnamomi TaxID=4785 RepID=UPI0035594068|nr:putative soluble pyridine nucleotide transhydrogenase [Phytophthora cinnamomi]